MTVVRASLKADAHPSLPCRYDHADDESYDVAPVKASDSDGVTHSQYR